MVATARITSGRPTRVSRYFVSDYYLGQGEGYWFGSAAPLLGFVGAITRAALEAALCGRSAKGKQIVKPFRGGQAEVVKGRKRDSSKEGRDAGVRVRIKEVSPTQNGLQQEDQAKGKSRKQRQKERQNVLAVEIQFAAMKSLSLLWALCPSLRPDIERIFRESVEVVLQWIEQRIPLARRGKDGVRQLQADVIVATFLHSLSRAEEPQLHMHCLFMQMAKGIDGRFSKINSRLLFAMTPSLGRIFRATLAEKLQSELGLELIRPVDAKGREKSWYEIKGIPQALIDANSSRRKDVLKEAGSQGLQKGAEAARLRQEAAYKTREAKRKSVDLDQVFERCRKQALELGIKPESLERLVGRAKPLQPEQRKELYRQAFDDAIKNLTREQAHFGERDIVCEVVERLQHHGFKGTDLADRVMEEIPRRPDLVPLREVHNERRFTTKELWSLEERLLKDVEVLRKRKGALLTYHQTEAVIREHKQLSDEQKKAVRHLLSRKRAVRLVTGVAGSGKSTALEAVRKGFEKAGYTVSGGALAGTVARDLETKVGIKSRTIASHLWWLDRPLRQRVQRRVKHDLRMLIRELRGKKTWKHSAGPVKLDSKSVLIIDEASMVAMKEMASLTRLVRKAGATLILTGDSHQLPPVGPGMVFANLLKTLPSAELLRNLRQQDPADRDAVSQLREGNVAEALKNYADRGRLVVADNRMEAMTKLVTAWRDAGGIQEPKKHQILVQTHRDAKLINRMCQQERLDARKGQSGHCITVDGEAFFKGDRVITYSPVHSQGVKNGEFGTIVAVDPVRRKVVVKLEQSRTKEERARGFRDVVTITLPPREQDILKLAYACTAHKRQGATVDHAYLLLGGPLSGKQMAYVTTTRARQTTRLFVDKDSAGNVLVELERTLKRSRDKQLAHDLGLQQSR